MKLSEKVLFLIFEIRIGYCLNFNKGNLHIVYAFDLVNVEYLCNISNSEIRVVNVSYLLSKLKFTLKSYERVAHVKHICYFEDK